MAGDPPARFVLTDEPYNVKIAGNVSKSGHGEFVMVSGEMTDLEFLQFNRDWINAVLPFICKGGVLGTYIDWRGLTTVQMAAKDIGLTALNVIVWVKTNAGMGMLYRSQHEFLPMFKVDAEPHVNNIELGKRGRWRSNVWTYPGATSFGSNSKQGLKMHPTVKPAAMLKDALLDLTNRGDIVIDPFLGSGSTLIAADATARICRGVELDPLYVSAYTASVMTTTIADVMIIYATLPFVAAAIGYLVNRERVSACTLVAAGVAFAGIAIMVANGLGSGRLLGQALSALMTVSFAGMVVLQRRRPGASIIAVNAIGALKLFAVLLAIAPPSSSFGASGKPRAVHRGLRARREPATI